MPALLARLQHLLHRPGQLLHGHPPRQEKPLHFLWHSSCPCTYQHCEYLGKNYFSRARETHSASSQFLLKIFPLLSSILFYDSLLFFPRVMFSIKLTPSVYCHLMLPSLWRSTAPCGCSCEVQFGLDNQPCSVLLHQPQHHQDDPAIQGEQCLPHLIFLSS